MDSDVWHSLIYLKLDSMGVNSNIFSAMKHFQNLRFFDLQNNSIEHIGHDTFMTNVTSELLILNLKRNNLLFVEKYYFKGLQNLQVLVLSHNRLVGIKEGAFEWLNDLILLDISSNDLSVVH